MTKAKTDRIRKELKTAGMTSFGMLKFATRYLPEILHDDEHIKGVVYGRHAEGTGLLGWVEAMLIATDRRVIFLDRKPGFENMQELTYDVVSGVQRSYVWPFSSLALYTKIGNYSLRFANRKCIDIFMHYVEQRQLEVPGGSMNARAAQAMAPTTEGLYLKDKVLSFMQEHDMAVLSTSDISGNVHGAAVHYVIHPDGSIHMLTKNETQKARNIFVHSQVALTLYDRETLQTLQMHGVALPESDRAARTAVFMTLSTPKVYGENLSYPPVTALENGDYTVLRFLPSWARLSDFGKGSIKKGS